MRSGSGASLERDQREGEGDLERRRRRQSGAAWDVAADLQSGARQRRAGALQLGYGSAHERSPTRSRRRMLELEAVAGVEVACDRIDAPVIAATSAHRHAFPDRKGKRKAVVVVGVLTDQVHAPGREGGRMTGQGSLVSSAVAVRWGIMSTAAINRLFLAGARQAADVEIVAVASRDRAIAERLRARAGNRAGTRGLRRAARRSRRRCRVYLAAERAARRVGRAGAGGRQARPVREAAQPPVRGQSSIRRRRSAQVVC